MQACTESTGARTLLLVRHGLPDYRYRGRADEVPGPPLSETGRRQALQAAEFLARYGMEIIYSSPLSRALQTARCITQRLRVPLRIDSELSEWHRTESLFQVNQRSARWLACWLRGSERCAAVVGHASPLLSILRTALYLPHVPWHHSRNPQQLRLDSADRFEISMACVVELTIGEQWVRAELAFHPQPRILDAQHRPVRRNFPLPVIGGRESTYLARPNLLHLVGAGNRRR